MQEIQASPLRKGKADSSETANSVTQLGTSPKLSVSGQQQPNNTQQSQTLQQPPKLAKSISKTSSVQPPSLCYYESYFDDSYVGDFTGDVDSDGVEENIETDLHNWCDDSSISNSILEFGFDSFGPESLLFMNGNADQNDNDGTMPINDAESELLSLSVTEPQLKEKVDACFDQRKIRTTYDLSAAELPLVQEMNDNTTLSDEASKVENREVNGNTSSAESNRTEENEPANGKLSNIEIFVNNMNESSELTVPNEKESRPSSAVSSNDDKSVSLSRSSTLNRSLRRKIKPKFNFEQILNNSDETSPPVVVGLKDENSTLRTLDNRVHEIVRDETDHAVPSLNSQEG